MKPSYGILVLVGDRVILEIIRSKKVQKIRQG